LYFNAVGGAADCGFASGTCPIERITVIKESHLSRNSLNGFIWKKSW